jgi:DNA-directed RNA polymerase specialized sigma24 family protein
MKDLGAALARLDPESRALLELSMRRGMPEHEIGEYLSVDPNEVGRRRGELFERLAEDLQLDGREQRDELYATLQDLPDECWSGRPQAERA